MVWQDELEEKFVETNGIKLHTILIGKGEPFGIIGFLSKFLNIMI